MANPAQQQSKQQEQSEQKKQAEQKPRSEQQKQSEESRLSRRAGSQQLAGAPASSFSMLLQLMDNFDRFVDEVGLFGAPLSLPGRGARRAMPARDVVWAPAIEVLERDGQLVVRADVPGLAKDDLHVEIRNDELVISGERTQRREEDRSGTYRSEVSYGSFYRAIALPEGVDTEHAVASFENGVLEIRLPMPARKEAQPIPIQSGSPSERSDGGQKNQPSA